MGPCREYQYLPNQVSFAPRGVMVRSNRPITVQFIQIRQTPETYDLLISDMVRGGAVDLEPTTPFDDPLVSQIMSTIANEMKDGFRDRILVDALNTALAARIVRRFVDPSAIALTPFNGLSRERLNRVQDHIEAHLDHRLSLTEISGSGLSELLSLQPFLQAGNGGRAAALRHAAAARTGKNLDAAEQSAAGRYRAAIA
jgi:hypothetical protein